MSKVTAAHRLRHRQLKDREKDEPRDEAEILYHRLTHEPRPLWILCQEPAVDFQVLAPPPPLVSPVS